jgi:peptidoglycan/LPS O-acetylase OafA/YrhL
MPTMITAPVEKDNSPKHWLEAWHVSPSTNRDYDFIDGLRGIAILMVIAAHHFYINPKSGPLPHYIESIMSTGVHGVTLFFALSGFLISWPFWKRKVAASSQAVPPGYFQRRFWKIYPPLVLSVLIFTPVYILTRGDWSSFISIAVRWLTGIAFIVPVSGKFNPVMWTLVIEVQFYLVLPLLFLALKRVPAKPCLAIVTLIFLVVPTVIRLAIRKTPAISPDINVYFPSALDVFCLGILVAGLENLGLIKKSWVRWGVAGVVLWPLTLLTAAWLNMRPIGHTFMGDEMVRAAVKLAAGCLLLLIADPQHSVARFLCAPWLRWCGIISYEWYLFHQPLANWSRVYLGPAGGNPIKYVLIIAIPLVAGLILTATVYRFFSLPLLRYGRGRNKG